MESDNDYRLHFFSFSDLLLVLVVIFNRILQLLNHYENTGFK